MEKRSLRAISADDIFATMSHLSPCEYILGHISFNIQMYITVNSQQKDVLKVFLDHLSRICIWGLVPLILPL